MASDVDRRHFGGYDANERDVLIYVYAFSNEILSEPPHFISAKVLVLECKLHIVRFARIPIELEERF